MKMSKKLQEIKKDNKGFSLVELIIVIAIMAILIGIVGMNVIPQIENANVATDAQVLSAVVSEATEAWTQVDHAANKIEINVGYNSTKKKLTFTPKNSGNAAETAVANQIIELEGDGTRTFKSNAVKEMFGIGETTAKTILLTCDPDNGVSLDVSTCDKLAGYEFESR